MRPTSLSTVWKLLLDVGEIALPPARRRARHDHTATLTGRFASRQHRSLARPVRAAAVFGGPRAEPCVLQTGCRVPQGAKEPRTTRPKGGHNDRRRTQEDHD